LLGPVIKEIQARRIAIDSLSHLEMYVAKGDLRMAAYRILMYLKTRGVSPVALWEAQQTGSFNVTEAGMSFLVDCILFMKFVEMDSAMKRALLIMKMRGSDHDKRLREYQITSKGVEVAGSFSGYEGIMTGTPHKSRIEEISGSWDAAFTKSKQKH